MTFLKTVGAILLTIAIVIGGYLGYWALSRDVNNRQAHLNRTTFEQQTTYRDEMIRKIADVRTIDSQIQTAPDPAPLQAQRAAIVDIVCRDNTHINGGLDASTAAFVARECR